MDTAISLLEELRTYRRKGYGKALGSPVDDLFVNLADVYLGSNGPNRQAIREAVNDDTRLLLLGFCDRLAILAERTGDSDMLLRAGMAHAIEDFRFDDRENVFRLALILHVAEKLRVDVDELFEKVKAVSSERSCRFLKEFQERPKELKGLQAMGIVEEMTCEGVTYRYE